MVLTATFNSKCDKGDIVAILVNGEGANPRVFDPTTKVEIGIVIDIILSKEYQIIYCISTMFASDIKYIQVPEEQVLYYLTSKEFDFLLKKYIGDKEDKNED